MSKRAEADYSEKETVERREATLKRMLATPPKPRKGKGAVTVKGAAQPKNVTRPKQRGRDAG